MKTMKYDTGVQNKISGVLEYIKRIKIARKMKEFDQEALKKNLHVKDGSVKVVHKLAKKNKQNIVSLKAIGKIKVKKKGQPDTVIEEPVEIVKSYWFDKSSNGSLIGWETRPKSRRAQSKAKFKIRSDG